MKKYCCALANRAIIAWFLLLSVGFSAHALASAPPLLGLAPPSSRQKVIREAQSFKGAPYRLGGTSKSGIDCSGLVYVSFFNATGIKIPRSVDLLARWIFIIPSRELIPGDLVFFDLEAKKSSANTSLNLSGVAQNAASLARADHVGIYLGEGFFIHSASSGSKTGVIENSINEASWKNRFLFAGRALPKSSFAGFAIDGGFGVNFSQIEGIEGGLLAFLRGISGWGEASYPLFKNFLIGVRAGAHWDRALSTVRIPLELDIGQISGVSIFCGPALTCGTPALGTRNYSPSYSLLGTIGVRWSPLAFSSGAQRFGSYIELRYDNYIPQCNEPIEPSTDLSACVSLNIGLRLRNVHY